MQGMTKQREDRWKQNNYMNEAGEKLVDLIQ